MLKQACPHLGTLSKGHTARTYGLGIGVGVGVGVGESPGLGADSGAHVRERKHQAIGYLSTFTAYDFFVSYLNPNNQYRIKSLALGSTTSCIARIFVYAIPYHSDVLS